MTRSRTRHGRIIPELLWHTLSAMTDGERPEINELCVFSTGSGDETAMKSVKIVPKEEISLLPAAVPAGRNVFIAGLYELFTFMVFKKSELFLLQSQEDFTGYSVVFSFL